MNSRPWKCKYCGNSVMVAAVMEGRRVRCPACASFSRVGRAPHRSALRGAHFSGESTVVSERVSHDSTAAFNGDDSGSPAEVD